jgi:cell division inhibitor SulA
VADFKKLRVWKSAHSLALCAHQTALTIRGAQYASLRSQIIRASMSIPANIVVISEAVFVGVLTQLKDVRMMLFGLLKRLGSRRAISVEPGKASVVQ